MNDDNDLAYMTDKHITRYALKKNTNKGETSFAFLKQNVPYVFVSDHTEVYGSFFTMALFQFPEKLSKNLIHYLLLSMDKDING